MTETAMEQQPESTQEEEQIIDPQKIQDALERMASEQNLVGGIIAGLVASLAGAAIWAVVTVVTGYQIGWMAIGVGFLVGYAVRIVGKGIDKSFAIAGALFALLGCLLGNLFTTCHFIASAEEMGFIEVLTILNPAIIADLMKATFSPMDVVFYGIAVYEGYKLSIRQVTQEDIATAIDGPNVQRDMA